MIFDLDNSTVEAIAEGNDTAAAVACFSQLSEKQIASVEAVAMDMSAAYLKAAKQVIPLAEENIVHDRVHVMQMATIDGIPRRCNYFQDSFVKWPRISTGLVANYSQSVSIAHNITIVVHVTCPKI